MVVAEGVTDVWRQGYSGAAIFGKTLSEGHKRLLREWRGSHAAPCLLVLLLDPDAWVDQDPRKREELLHELTKIFTTEGFFEFSLPAGTDPGSLGRLLLWGEIDKAATAAGIAIGHQSELKRMVNGTRYPRRQLLRWVSKARAPPSAAPAAPAAPPSAGVGSQPGADDRPRHGCPGTAARRCTGG